jgi:Phage QLRG family, putative DNA packaging.
MSYVTLAEAKAHLLVIHNFDDTLIQQNIDAAEAYAANYMNRPAIEDNPHCTWLRNQPVPAVTSSEPNDPVPKSVVQAILLLTADYWENRTATIVGTIATPNPAAENLLWFHRIGMGI